LILTVALATPTYAADKPIDGRTPPPGFIPPSLIGVQHEGNGPRIRPIPFPAADETWEQVRSAHFTILSSLGERRTRAMVEGLETLAAALTRVAPAITSSSGTPALVLAFGRHREVQPYFDYLLNRDNAHVSGVFVNRSNDIGSMIVDAGADLPSDRTPFHELVHSLIERSNQRAPLWLEEGLAEYFSAAEMRNGSLNIGAPPEHLEALRHTKLLPVADLFGVIRQSETYNLPAGQRLFYAESWATVDALMRAAGPHPEQFYDFVHDLESGMDVPSALRSRFNLSTAELDQTLRAYGRALHSTFSNRLPVANVDVTVTTSVLTRDDLLFELGAFLRALDPDSSEAARHFKAALEINPRQARALAALGRYDEAIAADPTNADIYLTYAESLLGTQIGLLAEADQPEEKDLPKFRKARELAAKALTLGGDEARARGDYGVSFLIEGDADLGPGIEALRRAHDLAPARNDYAVHLFAFLRRSGDRAEPLLAQLLVARSKQVAYAARAIVVRTELARANVLVHAERLDDAAVVLRSLADDTQDADARRNLLQQATELTQTAATNRQIALYNDAIAQVNTGHYAAARKLLTTLLATATDPGVVRDANKLAKELAGRRDLHR
jgi:tetratricopeptide (TPR) repeat protein